MPNFSLKKKVVEYYCLNDAIYIHFFTLYKCLYLLLLPVNSMNLRFELLI